MNNAPHTTEAADHRDEELLTLTQRDHGRPLHEEMEIRRGVEMTREQALRWDATFTHLRLAGVTFKEWLAFHRQNTTR